MLKTTGASAEDPYSLHNAFHDITTGSYGGPSNLDETQHSIRMDSQHHTYTRLHNQLPVFGSQHKLSFRLARTNTGLADGKRQLTWTNGEEDGKNFHQG